MSAQCPRLPRRGTRSRGRLCSPASMASTSSRCHIRRPARRRAPCIAGRGVSRQRKSTVKRRSARLAGLHNGSDGHSGNAVMSSGPAICRDAARRPSKRLRANRSPASLRPRGPCRSREHRDRRRCDPLRSDPSNYSLRRRRDPAATDPADRRPAGAELQYSRRWERAKTGTRQKPNG